MLARYDAETGPNARIGMLRDLGPALARAGDRAGALELYTREQQLLQAKSDGRYEHDMQDVQNLIKAESDKCRRAASPNGAAPPSSACCWRWSIALVARRQIQRNRQLAHRNDALLMQVEHDPLTGLANRAHLQARVAETAGDLFEGALFLIDADHFKDINDRHGHAAGDTVLVAIARRLEGVLRLLKGNKQDLTNNLLFHFRYNRKLSEAVRWEVFTQWQQNTITNIDQRFL